MLPVYFENLSTSQKHEVVISSGTYVMTRNAGLCNAYLYNYRNTYVEVWKFVGLNFPIRIEPLKSLDDLEPYLKNIIVPGNIN